MAPVPLFHLSPWQMCRTVPFLFNWRMKLRYSSWTIMLKGWADGRGASVMSLNIKHLLPWDITLPIRSNFVTSACVGRVGAGVRGGEHKWFPEKITELHLSLCLICTSRGESYHALLAPSSPVRCGAIDSSYTTSISQASRRRTWLDTSCCSLFGTGLSWWRAKWNLSPSGVID